ncbi:MAG TPA: flavodoxin family protein [Dehalococcoidia bacterium]|nr:flavodoxin family protein [Dehalococcoidia bacterium]
MSQRKTKVLALLGSPRKQGNTDIMADEVLEGARAAGANTSKVYLDDYHVRPIAEVADNSRQRDDPRRDDDFPLLLERFLSADIVIWSTPVYWQGPSAQMKCFLDRMSSYFNHPEYVERFRGKGHIVLYAFGRPEQEHGDWITRPMKLTVEVLHGIYLGDICASVYQKGKVRQMPEILEACRQLGADAVNAIREQKDRSHK